MKKILFALGICLLMVTQVVHAQSRLQEILDKGVLRVG
ncbi:amino acid ABC transporter substrate-binding protein, partial [Vibrio sp. Vb2865]|nr:amino acid ABC transporter substrate-binding protein [Vibrio sp. Vb2865]